MNSSIKRIYSLLIVLSVMGCKDALVKYPLDEPSNATFYKNRGEVEMAVAGVYNRLWWHIDTHHALLSLDNTTEIGFLRDGSLQSIADGSVTSMTGAIEAMWIHLYSGVGRANNVLANLETARGNVPDDFLQRVEAEARFLRAYFYHHLVELFGGVPLLTHTPPLADAAVGRSAKSEVVSQIREDLQYAKSHLPPKWQGGDAGRVTSGAASLLLARVALYNEDYALAIAESDAVISSGEYRLHPDYRKLFDYDGIRSSEAILDVPYQQGVMIHGYSRRAGSRMAGCVSTVVPSQAMVDSYPAIDGMPIDKSPLYDPRKPFLNRDPRLAASIIHPQSVFFGYVFETHPDSTSTWRIVGGVPAQRVGNQDVTNAFATYTGYLWRKYNSEADLPDRRQASELSIMLMRYAEALLIYAEAKIERNEIDQSVLDAVNTVRSRAYGVSLADTDRYPVVTTTSQQALRTIIRTERKIELANEGFHLYDIRRWKLADRLLAGPVVGRPLRGYETISSIPQIDEHGNPRYDTNTQPYRQVIQRSFRTSNWLFPIPQAEINVNDKIIQNEDY